MQISKVSIEISHKMQPYTTKYASYEVLKFVELWPWRDNILSFAETINSSMTFGITYSLEK